MAAGVVCFFCVQFWGGHKDLVGDCESDLDEKPRFWQKLTFHLMHKEISEYNSV